MESDRGTKAVKSVSYTHLAVFVLQNVSLMPFICIESIRNAVPCTKDVYKRQTLVIVCNFSDVVYEDYVMGVPYAGEYLSLIHI